MTCHPPSQDLKAQIFRLVVDHDVFELYPGEFAVHRFEMSRKGVGAVVIRRANADFHVVPCPLLWAGKREGLTVFRQSSMIEPRSSVARWSSVNRSSTLFRGLTPVGESKALRIAAAISSTSPYLTLYPEIGRAHV